MFSEMKEGEQSPYQENSARSEIDSNVIVFFENVSTLFGLSFLERYQKLGELLLSDFKSAQRRIATYIGSGRDPLFHCDPQHLSEFLAAFGKISDSMFKKLEDELNEENIFRFLGFIYQLGVLIHPLLTGNSRFFRALALSYFYEIFPHIDRHFWLPKKVRLGSPSGKSTIHNDLYTEKIPLQIDRSWDYVNPEETATDAILEMNQFLALVLGIHEQSLENLEDIYNQFVLFGSQGSGVLSLDRQIAPEATVSRVTAYSDGVARKMDESLQPLPFNIRLRLLFRKVLGLAP